MKKIFSISCFTFTILLSACQPAEPTSQVEQSNEINNVHVIAAEPTENLIDTEDFPLPNCGGTSELRQTLGTQVSVTKSVTIGSKATIKGGGEVDLPELAKLELAIEVEGAYQKTYESANSRLDTIGMQAEKGTHVIYTIGWYEQTYSSLVEYSANGQVYEAPYSYKLRVPKIESSKNLSCSNSNVESTFTGTWQGIDPYDNSTTTISLIQVNNELTGAYNDSFSLNVNPPGYSGEGQGTLLSPTSAQMVFSLSRWDGNTVKYELNMSLSNQGNTLTIIDPEGYQTIMQKK